MVSLKDKKIITYIVEDIINEMSIGGNIYFFSGVAFYFLIFFYLIWGLINA
jgi:hypothetical protein